MCIASFGLCDGCPGLGRPRAGLAAYFDSVPFLLQPVGMTTMATASVTPAAGLGGSSLTVRRAARSKVQLSSGVIVLNPSFVV